MQKACLFFEHIVTVLLKIIFEKSHEFIDFLMITFPIFRREAPDSKCFYIFLFSAPIRNNAKIFHSLRMTVPWMPPLCAGPASVAIGNDGEMQFFVRHARTVELYLKPSQTTECSFWDSAEYLSGAYQ